MLTLQEIQSTSFEKAVFGGYDMKSVDMFVEQLTEDYAALQKENAALKAKMKVLVDKIEEYRSVEDGMRKALLSAQNIANGMVEKAKQESAQVIQSAKKEAEMRISQYRAQMHDEENRLAAARRLSEDFIAKMTAYYQGEISNLAKLSAVSAVEPEEIRKMSPELTHSERPSANLEKTKELNDIEVPLPDDIAAMMNAAKKSISESSSVIQSSIDENDSEISDDSMKMKVFEVTLGGTPKQPQLSQVKEASESSKFDFANLRFGKAYSPDDDK